MKAKGKRILVVDDEPPIQRMLRRSLTANGYDVLVAEDGRQAIDIMHMHQPDLVLLDLCLPGELNGLDVCKQLRTWAQTPIIVLSAVTQEKKKDTTIDTGARDYFTKTFSYD